MTFPQPETDGQYTALQAIWELFAASGEWPTFDDLDRLLDQAHGIDNADAVLTAMPVGLLHGVAPGRPEQMRPTQEIRLTVAGAFATGKASEELELFRRAVRLAADIERVHQPEPDGPSRLIQPRLAADEIVRRLKLPAAERAERLARLRALLLAEQWGWQDHHEGDPWWFTIGRGIRQFRDVRSIEEYWQRRELSQGSTPPAASAPSPSEPGTAVPPTSASTPIQSAQPPSPDTNPHWIPILGLPLGVVTVGFAVPAVNTSWARGSAVVGLGVALLAILLPWRRRRWIRWGGVAAVVLCLAGLAWSVPRGSAERPDRQEPSASADDAAPAPGTCVPAGTTVCRYLRLADGQEFNFNEWGQPHSTDVRLTAKATLGPAGEAWLSPAVAGTGPLDPRTCWTIGRWTKSPQVLSEATRACVWTPQGQHALVTLAPKPTGAGYTSRFTVALTTDSTEAEPPAVGRTVIVDNRVTNNMDMREDTKPARLTSQPRPSCSSGCVTIDDTLLLSGARINAVCQTQGMAVTNGQVENPDDDNNPDLWPPSTRWYGIRWLDGRWGLLSETWVRKEDRGGLDLPACR